MLNLAQREHTVNHPSENDMFAVEEITFCGCDEELSRKCVGIRMCGARRYATYLASVRVWARVGLEKKKPSQQAGRRLKEGRRATMESKPGPACFSLKFSSCIGNGSEYCT